MKIVEYILLIALGIVIVFACPAIFTALRWAVNTILTLIGLL